MTYNELTNEDIATLERIGNLSFAGMSNEMRGAFKDTFLPISNMQNKTKVTKQEQAILDYEKSQKIIEKQKKLIDLFKSELISNGEMIINLEKVSK